MLRICEATDDPQAITQPGIRSINIFYQCFHTTNIVIVQPLYNQCLIYFNMSYQHLIIKTFSKCYIVRLSECKQ